MTADEPQVEQAAPVAAPAQIETGWRSTLEKLIQRILANRVVHTVMRVMDTANEAGAPLFAAALAFTTLFAVVPLLLLFAGVLGWVIQDEVQRSALLDQLVSYFPPLRDVMSTSLESVVRERGTLSLIGLVGLIWGASSYYAALDEVMRRIFSAEHVRGFFEQRVRGILTVLVLVGLMIGVLVLSSVFGLVSATLGDGPLIWLLFPVAALGLMVIVMMVVYLLVPAAPPSWRAALPPAIVAGIGIGLLTSLFSLLTPWLIGGLLAFGVIATVFGALIWLSLSYQILLYGAAWSRIRRDAEIRAGKAAAAAPPYAD
jgi:membrane protein